MAGIFSKLREEAETKVEEVVRREERRREEPRGIVRTAAEEAAEKILRRKKWLREALGWGRLVVPAFLFSAVAIGGTTAIVSTLRKALAPPPGRTFIQKVQAALPWAGISGVSWLIADNMEKDAKGRQWMFAASIFSAYVCFVQVTS
ncbi:MAG: hypothetical protein DRJ03_07300 [Chloroflexi bacterium]|nr:MAG: hypothetical protein DRJ03_07300 [Chloroflexota bacterium]